MAAGKGYASTPKTEDYVGTGMFDKLNKDIPLWKLETGTPEQFWAREEKLKGLAEGLDLQWVAESSAPTAASIKSYYPDITSDIDIAIKHEEALREYNLARTKYFWLRMDTLDIEGPTKKLDIIYIDSRFKNGRMCDGPGLLKYELERVSERAETNKTEQRKIAYETYTLDANNTTRMQFKEDITKRFDAWKSLPEC